MEYILSSCELTDKELMMDSLLLCLMGVIYDPEKDSLGKVLAHNKTRWYGQILLYIIVLY